jgi:S1-C subfamily serine protease
VVAEGTQAGATLRPVFLGQGARFDSVKWSRPLLPLGGIAISPGALLFTLDGELIGATVMDGGAPAIVGARDLFDTAARLAASGQRAVADMGVAVQRLTAELALATGVGRGVIVAEVDSDGPATSVLEPGDVLTMVGDRPISDPGGFLLDVAQRRADDTVNVAFVRAGITTTATLTLRAADANIDGEAVSFVREPGVGTRLDSGGRERVPGLQPGDIVTRAAATVAPTPAQLRALLARPATSGFLTLVVRRGGRQQVIAARVAAGSDAAPR